MGELAMAAADRQNAVDYARDYDEQVKSLIKTNINALRSMMPSVVTPKRMLQLSMECLRRNPKLRECSPESFFAALSTCSALGLEPNAVDGLQNAYIIPRFNKYTKRQEATFELGYPGAIELMLRSGKVLDVRARAVHENDEFEYTFGTEERLRHKPAEKNPGELTHVYCVARLVDGSTHLEVMTRAEVDKRRGVSRAKDNGPWATWYDEMAKKTVLLYTSKWLPRSAEIQRARLLDGTTPKFENDGSKGELVPGERPWDDEITVEYEERHGQDG